MEPYHHQGCFWLSCVRDGDSIEFCKRLELNSAGGGNMPDSPSSLFLIPLVQPLTMNQMCQASVCILHFAFFQSKHCFVTIKELNGYSHSQEKLPTMGICLQGATQYLWWNISETKYFVDQNIFDIKYLYPAKIGCFQKFPLVHPLNLLVDQKQFVEEFWLP